ncbi:MAG: DNA-processing protein DprA [Bacteroidota bacterium]
MGSKEIYQIALSMLPGIGPVSVRNLTEMFGEVDAVFKMKSSHLKRVKGIGGHFADIILQHRAACIERAEAEMLFMEANGVAHTFIHDDNYPEKLKACADAPIVLFYIGDFEHVPEKSIAIVGTRKATPRGIDATRELVSGFAENEIEPLIVSGLAYGIDVAAHKAAMECNLKTWAILGHGFDIIYPAMHRTVADNIIRHEGCLVSEFPSVAKRDPKHFVRRNRIIAGLSDATVVVESARKGGAMVTADIAGSYNRDVFAFPGRVGDSKSKGCNHLIKTNRAALTESVDDVIYIMNWKGKNKNSNTLQKEIEFNIQFEKNEKIIVDLLKNNEYCDTDLLLKLSGLGISDLSVALLGLEMKSVINALPGKIYALKS